MRSLRLTVAVGLTLGAVGVSAQPTVYFNDFESTTSGITGSVSRIAYPGGCTSTLVCNGAPPHFYLGAGDGNPFRLGQSFSIGLAGLPTHTGLRISFDYLPLLSMDGSGGADGMRLDGDGTTLLNATFSNWDGNSQNYCPPGSIGGPATCARWTGSTEHNTLGYSFCCGNQVGSSLYQLSFDLAHTAGTATLTFTALSDQNWDDEGMGWDNIRVQALGVPTPPGVVPEPSTWALMAGGLLALGGLARRRRA